MHAPELEVFTMENKKKIYIFMFMVEGVDVKVWLRIQEVTQPSFHGPLWDAMRTLELEIKKHKCKTYHSKWFMHPLKPI